MIIRFNTKLAIGVASVGFLLFLTWQLPAYVFVKKPQDTQAIIRLLSSEGAVERLEAKRKLVEIGPNAVGPLLNYLDDLTRNPYPRFPLGLEQEGQRALERYHQKLTLGKQMSSDETRRLTSLIITDRLRNDVINTLGQLGAAEAVPLLVRIMWKEQSLGATEQMNAAMEALRMIGEKAVPELIAAVETADAMVSAERREEGESSRRIDVFRLKVRGTIVLGRIGDQRALPTLESLLKQTDDKFLLPYVEDAIAEIKRRSGI